MGGIDCVCTDVDTVFDVNVSVISGVVVAVSGALAEEAVCLDTTVVCDGLCGDEENTVVLCVVLMHKFTKRVERDLNVGARDDGSMRTEEAIFVSSPASIFSLKLPFVDVALSCGVVCLSHSFVVFMNG